MNDTDKTRPSKISDPRGTTRTRSEDHSLGSGRPTPSFTDEETIVMRSFAAGKSDKQICHELRMPLPSFQRLVRDLRGKTGACDRVSLLVWALRQKQCGAKSKMKVEKARILLKQVSGNSIPCSLPDPPCSDLLARSILFR